MNAERTDAGVVDYHEIGAKADDQRLLDAGDAAVAKATRGTHDAA